MPKYRIEARERFTVITVYNEVEAEDVEHAISKCKHGTAAYDSSQPDDDGDDEYLETLSVEKINDDGRSVSQQDTGPDAKPG
jgi:hypothetical protein